MATIGLAFVLENLRPASRRTATEVRSVVAHRARSHVRRPAASAPPSAMNQVAQPTPRWDLVAASFLAAAAFAGLAVGAAAGASGVAALGGVLLLASVAVRRPTLPWSHVLLVLLLVILFVPIRRYRIPGDLPFQLEPYRVLVGLIVLGWIASLLVDPRMRIRSERIRGCRSG